MHSLTFNNITYHEKTFAIKINKLERLIYLICKKINFKQIRNRNVSNEQIVQIKVKHTWGGISFYKDANWRDIPVETCKKFYQV